jgi:hypothetical protein
VAQGHASFFAPEEAIEPPRHREDQDREEEQRKDNRESEKAEAGERIETGPLPVNGLARQLSDAF